MNGNEEMEPGIDLDQKTLIQVLQNKLAQSAIREAQMEAAIQQLIAENNQLRKQLEMMEKSESPLVEVTSEQE